MELFARLEHVAEEGELVAQIGKAEYGQEETLC